MRSGGLAEQARRSAPTSRLASTCGRCETRAIRRSWVSASIATGRAPRLAQDVVAGARRARPRSRSWASGTRWPPRTGPRGRARRRRSRPRRGGGRRRSAGRAPASATTRLVEPTSLTTQSAPALRQREADDLGERADGRRRRTPRPHPRPRPPRRRPARRARPARAPSRDARVGVVPADLGAGAGARSQADRAADQPDAEDRRASRRA